MANTNAVPPNIWAVVVTYFPDLPHLERLFVTLENQGLNVVIVDNESTVPADWIQHVQTLPRQRTQHWIRNARNLGIGAAQNQGLQHALAAGAEYVTLLDQDSLPGEAMFERLVDAWLSLTRDGHRVFAVGPRLIDAKNGGTVPFIAYRLGIKRRIFAAAGDAAVECFALLASGTTVHRDTLREVGDLDESMFLEYVDIEWGARARDRGLRSFGIPGATLHHHLGDARIKIWGRLHLPLHSPLRHYYTFRNAIRMQRLRHVPWYWKASDLLRCLATAPLFIAFSGNASEQTRMILKGAWHGIAGRSGPLSTDAPRDD